MIQSLDRGLQILFILAESKSKGVTELAEDLRVNKSTIFRLLETMEARGLVQQDERTANKPAGNRALAAKQRPYKESRYHERLKAYYEPIDEQHQRECPPLHIFQRQSLRSGSGDERLSHEGFGHHRAG